MLFAACVNLTRNFAGGKDAGENDGPASSTGGAGGASAAEPDAAGAGSGGSVVAGGATTGGMIATGGAGGVSATGGAAGNVARDAGTVADATSSGDGAIDVPVSPDANRPVDRGAGGTGGGGAITGGTGGTATGGATTGGSGGTAAGGSAGSQAVDAKIVADAKSPGDGGIDVPFSPDTSLPLDLGTGSSDGPGTGGTGGAGGAGTGGAGTGGAGTGGATGPMIISVRFVGGRTGGSSGTTTMNATESAGFKPATNWNSATSSTGTLSSLAAADGSTTTASLTWNSPGVFTVPFTDASGDAHMMNGFLEARDAVSATISVTLPISMSGGYDVYVYCYGNIDPTTRTYQYKIGSTTHTVSQTGRSVTTFPGHTRAPEGGAGTYVVFSNVTGASFTLTATPASSTAVPPALRAPVNGIQIVYPSGS